MIVNVKIFKRQKKRRVKTPGLCVDAVSLNSKVFKSWVFHFNHHHHQKQQQAQGDTNRKVWMQSKQIEYTHDEISHLKFLWNQAREAEICKKKIGTQIIYKIKVRKACFWRGF